MRVPLRWLEEFIDLPTTDVAELSHAFDMLGHTVEDVEPLDVGWTDVVVGHVLDVTPHPDADKIRVCQVDTGAGATQIICGAWNFEAGATVPVARPGAVLPGGLEIGERTIRGVASQGMICSERELGIGDDHAGILVLEDGEAVGTPFANYVELPDVVFDLDVTPNRPDALSLLGIARDLSAWFDVEYRIPPMDLVTAPGETAIRVDIEDPEGCLRFTGREIRDVKVQRSPLRVRHRLHKMGTRAISNVVDVTNYVMFELGHPLHAFDADTIAGERLVIKKASQGERLETLDHVTRDLHPDDLIIYDEAGPTSMSGTMGGFRSEVSESTSRVLMEAASWNPPTIMNMWRRHDLRSEAATRFERGVDPNLADVANQRASEMVRQLCDGVVLEGSIDEVARSVDPWVVELPANESTRILGDGFGNDRVVGLLRRLGLEVESGDPLRVTVPTYRPDLTRPADLVEEVARIHGFDEFEATLPTGPAGGLTSEQVRLRRLQGALVGMGVSQAIKLPFVSISDLNALGIDTDGSELLTVRNPLREEESLLRPSLLPGLLDSARYNRSHGRTDVALFETGRVFSKEPDPEEPRLPIQWDRLAWVVVGAVGLSQLGEVDSQADGHYSLGLWRRLAAVLGLGYSLSAVVRPGYHPGRCAEVTMEGRVVGHVGELAPSAARSFDLDDRVAVAEFDLDPLIAPVPPKQSATPSLFPHVDFDLSFLVPVEMAADALVRATCAAADDLLESARVFDVFHDESLAEDMKALAITYRLRANDRTLEQKEIGSIRQAMIDAAGAIGARLRGA